MRLPQILWEIILSLPGRLFSAFLLFPISTSPQNVLFILFEAALKWKFLIVLPPASLYQTARGWGVLIAAAWLRAGSSSGSLCTELCCLASLLGLPLSSGSTFTSLQTKINWESTVGAGIASASLSFRRILLTAIFFYIPIVTVYKKGRKIYKKKVWSRPPAWLFHTTEWWKKGRTPIHCGDTKEMKRVSALHSDWIPCCFPEGIPVLMSHHSSTLPSPGSPLTPGLPAAPRGGGIASSEPTYLPRHPASRRTRSTHLPKRRHDARRGFGRKKTPQTTPPTPPRWLKPFLRLSFPARANGRAASPHPLLIQESRGSLAGGSAAAAAATGSHDTGRAALGWAARGPRAPAPPERAEGRATRTEWPAVS